MDTKYKVILGVIFGLLVGRAGIYFLINYSLGKKVKEEVPKKTITASPLKKDFDSFFDELFSNDFFGPNFSPLMKEEKI